MKVFKKLSIIIILIFVVLCPFVIDVCKTCPVSNKSFIDRQDMFVNGFDECFLNDDIKTYQQDLNATVTYPSYFNQQDSYAIFAKDQQNTGLCWAFSANLALEMYYNIRFGQMMDFSEAWVALSLYKSGIKDGFDFESNQGANITYFDKAIKQFGIMDESDFPFEKFYQLDSSNYNDYYNFYSQYANVDIATSATLTKFDDYNAKSSKKQEIIKSYKEQITNNGALVAGIYSSKTYDVNGVDCVYSTETKTNHAITLIGWDDNISLNVNGTTHTGAWIAKNSWGADEKDGLFYIMYDDTVVSRYVYGYTYLSEKLSDFSIRYSTISEPKFKNKNINLLNSKTNGVAGQKNLFNYGEDISFVIDYYENLNVPSYMKRSFSANIYYYGNDCTSKNDFQIKKIDGYQRLSVETNTIIQPGKYDIEVYWDYDSNGSIDGSDTLPFYVISGAELGVSYMIVDDASSAIGYSGLHRTNFNSFNTYNNSIYVFANKTDTRIRFSFTVASYSNVLSFKPSVGDSQKKLITANKLGYAYGECIIYMPIDNTKDVLTETITLKTLDGYNFTYDIIIYIGNSNVKPVYVNYQTNGGLNSIKNHSMYPSTYSFYGLDYAIKNDSGLVDWYTDKNLTNVAKNNQGERGILSTMVKTSTSTTNSSITHKYIFLFAKWKSIELTFNNNPIQFEYCDSFSQTLGQVTGGSGNYLYELTDTIDTISLTNNNLQFNRTPVNEYTLKILVTDLNYGVKKLFDVNVKINPMVISCTIQSQYSYMYDTLKQLTYTLDNNAILQGDNLNIELICNANNSQSGEYEIKGEYLNNNYIVNFTNGVYTVLPTINKTLQPVYGEEFTYVIDNLNFNYEYQGELPQGLTYNTNTISGTANNVCSNTVTVFKTNTLNYKDNVKYILDIVVKPKNIEYTINNITINYGENVPQPTGQISKGNVVNNDNLNISLQIPNINFNKINNAGIYDIVGTYQNLNYNVTFITGYLKINKINISCKIDNQQSLAGQPIKQLTYVITDTKNIVDINKLLISLTTSAKSTQKGQYPIEATCFNPNYNVSFNKATYTVNAVQVDCKIDNKTSSVGEPLKELTYTIQADEQIDANKLFVTLSTTATNLQAGMYDITGTSNSSIYDVVFSIGKYTVLEQNTKHIDFESLTYGNSINKQLDFVDGSYDVQLYNSNLPQGLSLQEHSIIGTPLECGMFDITLKATNGQNIIFGKLNLVVKQRQLTINIDDINITYGQAVPQFSGSITQGSIYNNDNLQIQYLCDYNNRAGVYAITAISNNLNYNIQFIDGTLTVNKKQLEVICYDYNGEFNEQPHSITIEVLNTQDYIIVYSLDGTNYSKTKPEFIQTTSTTVYFMVLASGYECYQGVGYITIN